MSRLSHCDMEGRQCKMASLSRVCFARDRGGGRFDCPAPRNHGQITSITFWKMSRLRQSGSNSLVVDSKSHATIAVDLCRVAVSRGGLNIRDPGPSPGDSRLPYGTVLIP